MTDRQKLALSGALAGVVNGCFGGGGGMVLLPALRRCGVEEKSAFATCVAIILPLCALSAGLYVWRTGFDLSAALPYLLGGLAGGTVGGRWMEKVSTAWLRRIFALFTLYGGVRYLL